MTSCPGPLIVLLFQPEVPHLKELRKELFSLVSFVSLSLPYSVIVSQKHISCRENEISRHDLTFLVIVTQTVHSLVRIFSFTTWRPQLLWVHVQVFVLSVMLSLSLCVVRCSLIPVRASNINESQNESKVESVEGGDEEETTPTVTLLLQSSWFPLQKSCLTLKSREQRLQCKMKSWCKRVLKKWKGGKKGRKNTTLMDSNEESMKPFVAWKSLEDAIYALKGEKDRHCTLPRLPPHVLTILSNCWCTLVSLRSNFHFRASIRL
jgi:hypothetical protein